MSCYNNMNIAVVFVKQLYFIVIKIGMQLTQNIKMYTSVLKNFIVYSIVINNVKCGIKYRLQT